MAFKRSRQAFEADLQRQESPYVLYGTPLPPSDEMVRDDGSFVPVWKQEVTDDRGRKRLHGAFTGGYSAGYFNTVGSKEGWTPSNFVSSRNKGNNSLPARQQRAEDFMDEEDLREAEEARSLQTSDQFAGLGTTGNAQRGDAVTEIFRPAGETVGEKLLKRMGWKEGQGIGPRIRREANLGEGQFSTGQTHTFAPPDVPVLAFTQKNDLKGLGCRDADSSVSRKFNLASNYNKAVKKADEDDGEVPPQLSMSQFKSLAPTKPRKGGFGVGVLNDTGSDDEDPYSMGPKISYNRTIGGDKPVKKRKPPAANPTLRSKPLLAPKKLSGQQSILRRCHDGRLPLDGFMLGDSLDAMASLSLKSDKYKPPDVPAGWVSNIAPPADDNGTDDYVSTADAAKASNQTSKSRATALGETQLPGKSVFDYLSAAARDRLAAASGKTNLPPGLGEVPEGYQLPRSSHASLQDLVPVLDQDVALQALNRSSDSGGGWMPYAEDPLKRERYRTFLEIRAGLRPTGTGDEIPPRAEGMSMDDWVHELNEFARAAEVFKPVSGLMASRFTSSSSNSKQADGGNPADPDSLLTFKRQKPEDPAEAAAKMGMFGHMTRSMSNFYPPRLLCKRFGVPMPDISNRPPANEQPSTSLGTEDAVQTNASRFSSARYQDDEKAERAPHAPESAARRDQDISGATAADQVTRASVVDPEKNDALEQEKPSMALFKAVFGSDDEDEDE